VAEIPDSAFVTVGESHAHIAAAEAGQTPKAEYFALRTGHFSAVHAMADCGLDGGSLLAGTRFALNTYRATATARNVFLGEEFPGIQYLAVHALRRRAQRIVMLIHNAASARRHLPLRTLRLARHVDHLLCLSEQSRRELIAQYRYPKAQITVVGSRVDTEFFAPNTNVQVMAQVCAAGAVNRDYDTLIDAVAPLGIPLKIAADTHWRFTAAQAKVRSLPPSVEMRSWGNYVNLRTLYAESAIVVVPLSRSLMSGVTVALEAIAMGKSVILTRVP
jgi:glycosyltransferase involved in cell wall biosynthesis